MSEETYAGSLIRTNAQGETEILMNWHYEVPDRHCLPEIPAYENAVALVNGELIYQHMDGRWQFDAIYTHTFYTLVNEESGVMTSEPTDPVTGIDFSSKPREEWTMGNWIAHVGGGIRSDDCVVFGSVMAVDMMIKQIIKQKLKEVAREADSGPLRCVMQGGTHDERLMMWAHVNGMIEGVETKSAEYLQSVIDKLNAGKGLNYNKTMEFLMSFSDNHQLLMDIAKDTKTGE